MNKKLELITIGKITTPHGVRGDVCVYPETEFPERFLKMKNCYLDGQLYKINYAKLHKKKVIIKFEEIANRNEAELLLNKELQILKQDLMPLEKNRYYIFDIIGLEVFDNNNNFLGILSDVLKTGSNDVYVIKASNKKEDLLLPALKSVIISTDIENKKMVVNLPEWF